MTRQFRIGCACKQFTFGLHVNIPHMLRTYAPLCRYFVFIVHSLVIGWFRDFAFIPALAAAAAAANTLRRTLHAHGAYKACFWVANLMESQVATPIYFLIEQPSISRLVENCIIYLYLVEEESTICLLSYYGNGVKERPNENI